MTDLTVIPYAPSIHKWASVAHEHARAILEAAPQSAFECEGTWFVGVDALPNDEAGAIGDIPFPSEIHEVITQRYGAVGDLHPAQLSTVYHGYPKPRQGESETAFAYRRDRDGAHVDGLLPVGPERRRFVIEPHRYILGIPLTPVSPNHSPMIFYEGSSRLMRAAFHSVLGECVDAQTVAKIDVTDIYQATRREVFASCPRKVITADVGSAYVMDPHALHGIAPWTSSEYGPRIVAYFRPQFTGQDVLKWCAIED